MNTKKFLRNEHGFALLSVVFLTLITSFAALILLNAATRAQNPQSTLRLTALHLANEQFAQLESMATIDGRLDAGSYSFQGLPEDLTTENFKSAPITFTVKTQVKLPDDGDEYSDDVNYSGNLREVKVTVSWTVGGKNFEIESERMIRVVEKPATQNDDLEENP